MNDWITWHPRPKRHVPPREQRWWTREWFAEQARALFHIGTFGIWL